MQTKTIVNFAMTKSTLSCKNGLDHFYILVSTILVSFIVKRRKKKKVVATFMALHMLNIEQNKTAQFNFCFGHAIFFC